MIDFFQLYFIDSDDPEKDIIIRFYLSLIKIYIEYYKRFEEPLLEIWSNKIKPYILEKYPDSNQGIFKMNSDIHYLIQLVDGIKEKYQVKIEKKQEKIGFSPTKKKKKIEKIEKKENKNNFLSKEQHEIQKQEKKVEKKFRFSDNDDLKKLRSKINNNINKFLVEFKEEKQLKRANSMKLMRSSNTISSLATRADSIYNEDNNEGRFIVNLKNLMEEDDNQLNISKNKTKDIIGRSQNIKQLNLEKIKTAKNKSEEITNKNKGNVTMTSKFKEVEIELEGISIGFKDKNKNILDYISIDLLLKKIIFEKYLEKYTLLIYHLCQQCFCFVDKEILFKKLFGCYKFYKMKKIDFCYLINLIKFINVLIIEMFEYYEKIEHNEKHIVLIKNYYTELIIDLMGNSKQKENKLENKIIGLNIDVNNDLITNPDFHFDRNNLINANLNLEIKNISQSKEKEDMKNNKNKNYSIQKKNKIKKKEINKVIDEDNKNILLKSKTMRNTIQPLQKNSLSNNIFLDKIDEDIKEENKEEDIYSDNESQEEEESKEKQNNSFEESITSSDDEIKNDIKVPIDVAKEKLKSEYIRFFKEQVFIENDKIISANDQVLNEIKNLLYLFDIKDKENISKKNIKEAKSLIPFYEEIKIKKKLLKTNNNNNNIILKNSNSSDVFQIKRKYSLFEFSTRSNLIIKSNPSNKNYFCVTDWSAEDIGNKLAQVSISFLNEIKPRELYKGVYLKKDKETTSPNVVKCINNFNKLTSFIIEDILSYNSPKLRARSYKKWVEICEFCKKHKNYNDCIAIFSALNNYIITGLDLTLKEVKSQTKQTLDHLSIFCTVEGNYKNIRNDMNLCEQKEESFIPYLGMLLKDINFLEESSKYINEKGCINLDKIEKINSLIEKYFRYKKINKKLNDDNVNIRKELSFFKNLEIISEEQLEKIADNVEPVYKFDKSEIKRKTNIDKKYFVRGNKMNKRKTAFASTIKVNFGK